MAIPLPSVIEQRIIALLAQGDYTQPEIQGIIYRAFKREVNINTIAKIKSRNRSIIKDINDAVKEHDQATAESLLKQTHTLLSKALSNVSDQYKLLDEYKKEYMLGNLTIDEYSKKIGKIKIPNASELTNVSKEMYNQSRTDKELPTSYNDKQIDVNMLQNLMGITDEVELQRILFKKNTEVIEAEVEQTNV